MLDGVEELNMIKVQKNSMYGVFQSSRTAEIKAMMDPLVRHIDATSLPGDSIELKISEWPEQYKFMKGVPKFMGCTVNWI